MNSKSRSQNYIAHPMKYLNNQALFSINQELTSSAQGPNVYGKVEAFEVEPDDVKDYRKQSLDRNPFQNSYGQSPEAYSPNPMYNLDIFASSSHFPALKSTISAAFPDFDFSNAFPWHFKLIQSTDQVRSNLTWFVNSHFQRAEFLSSNLWKTIDCVASLSACDIYLYEPDCPDAFSEMGINSHLTYFFVNEKASQITLLHLREGAIGFDSMSDDEAGALPGNPEGRYAYESV